MTAEPLRERARHLYHHRGRTAHRVAKQLDLPLGLVLKLVRDRPLPTCKRPGCRQECSHDGARYCSRACSTAALAARNAADGCGCTDRRLCQRHQAMLDEMRAR